TNFEFTMGGEWLEVLKEVSPWLVRIAVLYTPKTAPYAGSLLRSIAAAAPSFAVEPIDTPIMKLRRSSARSKHSHEHRMADWSYCQTPPLWFTASRLSRVPLKHRVVPCHSKPSRPTVTVWRWPW